MTDDITVTRTALKALIQMLANQPPDLDTEQGRSDYRSLLLAQNSADMLELVAEPGLDADAAVMLYGSVCRRLRTLLDHRLLHEDQAKHIVGEAVALYGRFRPELLPRLWTQVESTPDA